MKVAWAILLVSALTDFMIAAGAAVVAAMTATGNSGLPSGGVLTIALITGAMAGARTIQNALKSTPETAAALKGEVSSTVTTTEAKTP